jgi:group I intron endonuclease
MLIYKITNKINGKIYIGQTTKSNLSSYLGSGKIIKQAVEKYGKENFSIEKLEECCSKKHMNEREIYWIRFFRSSEKGIGYNISKGGNGGNLGQAVNELISKAVSGEKHRLFGKSNLARKGKGSWNKGLKGVYSLNTIEKMKAPKSNEHRKKLSEAKKGKRPSKIAFHNSLIKRQKSIICLNTGEVFNSIKEAELKMQVKASNIIGVLKGRLNYIKGLKFIYNDN